MALRSATPDDLPAIEALLMAAGLPLEGVPSAFGTGTVAIDGRVVGCAAIEPHGGSALLRSVAVEAERQGEGIGRRLVAAAERIAADLGADGVYLLTETAESWFESLGYRPIDRSEVPAEVAASVEFAVACPTTAKVMHRRLDERPGL